jgi:NhaP-type Na+/H+ or K+/H+ antiporter
LEGVVFSYLGLSFFAYFSEEQSYQFIITEFVILIISRFCGTVGLVYLFVLCKHKKHVSFKELLFIGYAGLTRGAIAFALVLQIDGTVVEKNTMVTTTLSLVILTTVIFGSFMPLVQKLLLGNT